jgi:hypothetical protein
MLVQQLKTNNTLGFVRKKTYFYTVPERITHVF